jgi:hypothetical protein
MVEIEIAGRVDNLEIIGGIINVITGVITGTSVENVTTVVGGSEIATITETILMIGILDNMRDVIELIFPLTV